MFNIFPKARFSSSVGNGLFNSASLDLDFAKTKSLVDSCTGQNLVTFTRASSGTYVDSQGVIRTATANEARFDHAPTTGESLGLLVEEQRTNSIRNNTMVGAVAGTPGTLPTNWSATTPANGITREIVGTGTEDGIVYIDFRFSGTNTLGSNYYMDITFDSGTITAAQNQASTESVYVKLLSGVISGAAFTSAVGLVLYGLPSFSDNGGSVRPLPATNARLSSQRFSVSHTFTNAGTTGASPRISWTIATGATIDFTLRIGMPQLEQGAFATSVIPTTTATATRSADVASITGTNFSSWYRQDEGTVFAEGAVAQPASGGNQFFFRSSDSSYNNSIVLNVQQSGFTSISTAAGGVFDGIASSSATLSANTTAKFAGAYAANNLGLSLNGATAVTDATATMPLSLGRADIGSDHAGLNRVKAGTIRRLTYWPQRLPNSTLQQITQ